MLLNSFCEASIRLMLKPDKDTTHTHTHTHTHTPHRPISLLNTDAKVLNKIPANLAKQHFKKIIHHDEVEFIPGMHGWSISANQSI